MKKRLLTADDMVTFFAVVKCCGEKITVGRDQLEEQIMIDCENCGEPLMIRAINGLWYHVGERVFD